MIIHLEMALTVILVVFFGVLVSFKYILNLGLATNQNARLQNENTAQYDRVEQYDRQFAKINAQVVQVANMEHDQLYWSQIFDKMNKLVFPGITLDSFVTNDYALSLGGTADNRDDLVLFKEKLTNEKCFSNVNLPLSDLVDQTNLAFQIDLDIQPSCLQKSNAK